MWAKHTYCVSYTLQAPVPYLPIPAPEFRFVPKQHRLCNILPVTKLIPSILAFRAVFILACLIHVCHKALYSQVEPRSAPSIPRHQPLPNDRWDKHCYGGLRWVQERMGVEPWVGHVVMFGVLLWTIRPQMERLLDEGILRISESEPELHVDEMDWNLSTSMTYNIRETNWKSCES